MIGKQKMTLSYESVLEAIDQYVNAHLRDESQVTVTQWFAGYGTGQPGSQSVDLEIAPPGHVEQQSGKDAEHG